MTVRGLRTFREIFKSVVVPDQALGSLRGLDLSLIIHCRAMWNLSWLGEAATVSDQPHVTVYWRAWSSKDC